MQQVIVYTDGSVVPKNPGFGGWAAILLREDKGKTVLKGGFKLTTNNRMELLGIIEALQLLGTVPCRVILRSDSQYVVKGINSWMIDWQKKGWRHKVKGKGLQPVQNLDLWRRLAELRTTHKLSAEWVRGHNGDFHNEECDALANAEASKHPDTHDTGYLDARKPEAFRTHKPVAVPSLFGMEAA